MSTTRTLGTDLENFVSAPVFVYQLKNASRFSPVIQAQNSQNCGQRATAEC